MPNRRRRLRKKLRVGEFQELGFSLAVQLQDGLSAASEEILLDAFLKQVIEPKGLQFGGSFHGAFIAAARRGSVTEADRQAVIHWLAAREEVANVDAGALVDAWLSK